MAPKQQLDKGAWQWAENTEPENVNQEHINTAYRINLKTCKTSACRRNCRGNPKCLNGIGEREWFIELDDSIWHDIQDPEAERRQEGDYVGLKNLGATCYVNTFIQVWFHNPEFRNAVLSWRSPEEHSLSTYAGGLRIEPSNAVGREENAPPPKEEPMPDSSTPVTVGEAKPLVATCAPKEHPVKLKMCEDAELMPSTVCGHLQLIFALLQFTNRRYIDPSSLINCLGLDAGQQQDAQEFSKLFMSVLEDQLSRSVPTPGDQSVNFIKDQFLGEYDYLTSCSGCSGVSRRPSSFYELDLNIKGHKELKECIGEFLQEEKLEDDNKYMCSTCNQKRNAIRRIKLSRLPKVLNLQLLRFVFDRNTGHKKKLNTFIQFPEVLDLSEYMEQPENSLHYELMAVLIHRGPSAYSGHYIAHIKDPHSLIWHKFNDEEIQKMNGKNLHLGNEEDIEGKDSKRPRTSKGFHCSRNAYMLVYRQKRENIAPVTPVTMDVLPERVKLYTDMDGQRFNDWVKEMTDMRELAVSNGRARQKEIQDLYNQLLTHQVHDDSCEWMATAWLNKWLTENTATTVPEIDNSSLLCPHGKLDPEKVTSAKCVSSAAAELLYSKYSGGPRLKLQETLCRACIVEQCSVIRLKARVAEDQKYIAASLKTTVEGDPESYWVGKASIRSWKRLALEKVPGTDSSTGAPVNSSEGNGTNSDTSANNYPIAMETEENGLSFNEDITCEEHNNLVLDTGCRRLVTGEVWQRLRKYFPDCPEFKYSTNTCEECRIKKEKLLTAQEAAKVAAVEQKASLPDLYTNRNRPTWNQNINQLNIVSKDFLDSWRKFVKEPGRHDPVTEVSNSSLLCAHGGFMHNPETACLTDFSQSIVYIWPAEWAELQKFFRIDVEINVTRIDDELGHVTFIVTPDICEDCHIALVEEERLARTAYSNAVIFVRKLTSENKNMLPPGAVPEDQKTKIPVFDNTKDDPEFSHTENGKRKRKDSGSSLEKAAKIEGGHSRRSSRHRRMRGEREFTVSAHQKLWDLKIMVMKAYSSPPMDQHFYLNGGELVGDQRTLGDLGVQPSSILYLQIDEPCEDPMMIDDMTKASCPEEGFKGTGLLGGL